MSTFNYVLSILGILCFFPFLVYVWIVTPAPADPTRFWLLVPVVMLLPVLVLLALAGFATKKWLKTQK